MSTKKRAPNRPSNICTPPRQKVTRSTCPPIDETDCGQNFDPTTLLTLHDVVNSYIRLDRKRSRDEIEFYSAQRGSLTSEAIKDLFRSPNTKRHSHQTRISRKAISNFVSKLTTIEWRKLKNFDQLHALIEHETRDVDGIGPLTVYDISHRIGARFNIIPTKVYLHAGTRRGALKLGLIGSTLDLSSFPAPFKKLSAEEIEDCLCIYGKWLRPEMMAGTR